MEEESFPRGHRKRDNSSASKQKSQKRKRDSDILFKEDDLSLTKKKSKRKKVKEKRFKRNVTGDDSDDDYPSWKTFENKEDRVNIGLMAAAQVTPKITRLSKKTLSEDMLLFGIVKEVSEYEMIVSLPNMMSGYVQITDVSTTYTKMLEKLGDRNMESGHQTQDIPSLQDLYSVGSHVVCKVKSVPSTGIEQQQVQLSLDPRVVHRHLLPSMLQPGMTISGTVSSLEDHGYIIDVGIEGVNGFLPTDHASSFIKAWNQGQPLFAAQPIKCLINDVKANGRSLILSANPTSVTKATAKSASHTCFDSLLPGTKVKATVKDIYSDHIKVGFLTSYSGCIPQLHFLDNTQSLSDYQEKQAVDACVIFQCLQSKSLGLSLIQAHLQPAAKDKQPPFQGLTSGDIIKTAKVLKVDSKNGILLQLNKQERALVQIPDISDKKSFNPVTKYDIGSVVRCRLLDFHLVDGIATASTKPSILTQPFLGYYDIKPGAHVKGTITAIEDKGLSIKISDQLFGYVPQLHMADVVIHKPQSKFTVGEVLELRVLLVNSHKRRLLLTHKKSLVHSDLPVVTSYDQPYKDMTLHGCIVAIKDFGYIVQFYSDVAGLIPRSEIKRSSSVPVSDDDYYLGQVVKCRVIKTHPPEAQRITLSLRLTPDDDQQLQKSNLQNPNVGQLTEVKVTNVTSEGLEVSIQPDGVRAFLSMMHLSDFVENCSIMLASYEKGDTITDVMHWSYSSIRNCVILTLKPLLKQSGQSKELVTSLDEVEPGSLVTGVVKRVMTYGVFIEFPNNIVGLAPKAAMSDDIIERCSTFQVGQTLKASVTQVDQKKGRILLSLRTSADHHQKGVGEGGGEGQKLLEQYFHERDVVWQKLASREEKLKKMLDIEIGSKVTVKIGIRLDEGVQCVLPDGQNGFIADLYIGERNIVEGSKMTVYVLHVDLSNKRVDLCLDPKLVGLNVTHAKEKKNKYREYQAAVVAMVTDNFILVCLKSDGEMVYLPCRTPLNDIPSISDLTVGQTMKVYKKRAVNTRVFASQFVTEEEKLKLKSEAHSNAPSEGGSRKEKKKKTERVLNAHSVEVGQKVTAVVKTVLGCQLNVVVDDGIMGRIHATEVTDNMTSKFPLHKFKEGMEVKTKVIGHLEVKNRNYLPITHRNFTRSALDLTLRPSKLIDDSYVCETLEKQLETYQPRQSIRCVVQKFVDSVLWVCVTGILQGKVYQLNMSHNPTVLEKPAKYFVPGSVRTAKVVKIDSEHKVLELTLTGSGSTELTPGMVTSGRILKILSGIGLVIQLPFGYRGRVFLTDLRDHFIKNPLDGYEEKQFIRCRVLAVTDKANVVLSMRPSAISNQHDPSIDRDIKSIQDLSEGDVIKGYVKNFTKVGVFVSLSSKVQGRIQLKKLSVSYISEPESLFPKGKLLTVKVLSIEKTSGKIELSSSQADTGADDPVPKELRTSKKRQRKRGRKDSRDDDAADSGLEEPETLSDAEVEVVEKMKEKKPVARLQVQSGFSWDTGLESGGKTGKTVLLGNQDDTSSDDEEENEDEAQKEPPRKKSKKEKRAEEKAEEALLYKTEHELMDADRIPETADDFDRLVLSSPDSSLVWVRYMAFHLTSSEVDKARAVAERALKTINFREEQEKLNIWVAFLNLENLHGSEESLLKIFERALQHCEPLKVFQNLVNIYSRTGKLELADQLYNTMVKRFNLHKEVWISYGFFLMKNGRHDAAHGLMQRSFKSLTPKEHIDVIVKFAQMEFKFGEAERGKTMFESVLSNYPKRTDIWSVYLDMMIKQADVQAIRHLFERVIHLNLSAKKMKFFFKRYLDFEKKCGSETEVAEVKRKAVEYVESKMVVNADNA